ncbi:MAG: AAA family ATPase, partial [Chloroflexota bacterium]
MDHEGNEEPESPGRPDEDAADRTGPGPGLGGLLFDLRRAAGLTQEQLSGRSSVGIRTIQAIESGVSRAPQAGTLRLLADALELEGSERRRFLAAARRARPGSGSREFRDVVDGGELAPILGRSDEIAAVEARFAAGDRFVTLVGPGGVGKTRLARAIARRWDEAHPGAVVWVSFEAVTDPGGILPAIARAVGIGELASRGLPERIADRLTGASSLLILDNFEHLVAAAPVAAALLDAAPPARLLVTSREALRVRGERPAPVTPCPLPPAPEAGDPDPGNPAIR